MIKRNNVLHQENKKPIVYDCFYEANNKPKPLVVFCHGYKGFKDWGSGDLVANTFMKANTFFVKFNFSHNGGTIENPIDFPDLEAFGENNYTKELDDLDSILNLFLDEANEFINNINTKNVIVIGHSRGGGITIIKAAEDSRITKLITWASVSEFANRTARIANLEQWKKDGVTYVLNGRTKQKMPHNYQFFENFKANENRLNIEKSVKALNIPHLIIHAKDDSSVKFNEAESLSKWNKKSELFIIENSDHVFGAKQPWNKNKLPEALNMVVKKSLNFLSF